MDDDLTWDADDLVLWSTAGYLLGRVDTAVDAMSRAHDVHVRRGDAAAAVRCGFWVVFMLLGRGDHAQASGWLARCDHEAELLPPDSAARGYLTLTEAQRMVAIERRFDQGGPLADQVVVLARRDLDPDLLALALMVAGRARIRAGETHDGFAMLDEVIGGGRPRRGVAYRGGHGVLLSSKRVGRSGSCGGPWSGPRRSPPGVTASAGW